MATAATTDSSAPGLAPPTPREVPSKTIWPTIGATAAGRWVGRLCAVRTGIGPFFALGKLYALLTIPVSLAIFFWQLLPGVCRRYQLTNRRIVIQKGLRPADESSLDLDQFDAIQIEVLPGQAFLHAGDLLFLCDGREVFRLRGAARPEVLRRLCLTARSTQLAVREILRQQQPVQETGS